MADVSNRANSSHKVEHVTSANGSIASRNFGHVQDPGRHTRGYSDYPERPEVLIDHHSPYQFTRSSSFRLEQPDGNVRSVLVYPRDISHEDTCQARDVEYNTIEKRLCSYATFPRNAHVDPQDLAENGLYYVGEGDKVKCAYCRGQMYNWEEGDSAFAEHLKHFPLCQFIITKDKRQKWEAEQRSQQSQQQPARPDPVRSETEARGVTDDHLSGQGSTGSSSLTGDEWEEAASVSIKVTASLGFEEELVKRAFDYLKKQKPAGDIKSAELIDIIFDMEDNPESYKEEETNKTEQITDHALDFPSPTDERHIETHVPEGASALAPARKGPQTVSRFAAGNMAPPGTFNIVQTCGDQQRVPEVNHGERANRQQDCTSITSTSMENHRQLVAKGITPSASENSKTWNTKNRKNAVEIDNGDSENKDKRDRVDSPFRNRGAEFCNGKFSNKKLSDSLSEKTVSDVASGEQTQVSAGSESCENAQKLKNEQTRLRQNVVCNICHRSKINVLFLPCRHLVACENCSEMDNCARCGKQIIATVKIFLV